MTEAGWTRERPTKEGYYWWKRQGSDPSIVRVDQELHVWSVGYSAYLGVNCFDGEFLGPLTPTDRQQGRVEAYTNVLKECEQEASQSFRGGDYQLACRYIAEHCREQLAQQAQEGGVGE